MRAGRPQLIVPYGWDQPDNGARIARLGAGLVLERTRYRAETAAAMLKTLLEDGRFAARAAEMGAVIQGEDAIAKACDAVEMRIPVRG
jgi:UDP:flavonoid glycosyltransferase YjiC (YdhE family)